MQNAWGIATLKFREHLMVMNLYPSVVEVGKKQPLRTTTQKAGAARMTQRGMNEDTSRPLEEVRRLAAPAPRDDLTRAWRQRPPCLGHCSNWWNQLRYTWLLFHLFGRWRWVLVLLVSLFNCRTFLIKKETTTY